MIFKSRDRVITFSPDFTWDLQSHVYESKQVPKGPGDVARRPDALRCEIVIVMRFRQPRCDYPDICAGKMNVATIFVMGRIAP